MLYDYSGNDKVFVIKDGTTVIADCAFENASNLEEVILPEGLKTIGRLAFFGSKIESIDIPASVNRIDECAFAMCNSLKEINVDPANKYYTNVDGVLYSKDMTELIWCPQRAEDEFTVPASVKLIHAYAFGASMLSTVVINNDDIILESGSLDGIRIGWDKDKENIITVVCNKDSNAYVYAINHGMNYIANEVILNGWINEDGKWAYYEDNVKLTSCWKKDSNGWCYLGNDGYMLTNSWIMDSTGWCHVGANGYMEYNKWVKDSIGWCYVGSSGYMVTSAWVSSGGQWYYMNERGYMVTGKQLIGGKYYTFNSGGVWIG